MDALVRPGMVNGDYSHPTEAKENSPIITNGHTSDINTTHSETNGTGYTIKQQWHSKPGHLRIVHVGAGAAGLLMAYKMKRDFENYDLVCYEK